MNTPPQSPLNRIVSAIAPGACLALSLLAIAPGVVPSAQAAPPKAATAQATADAGADLREQLAAKQLELDAVRKELSDLRASIPAKPRPDELTVKLRDEADKLRETLEKELEGFKVEAVDGGTVGPAQPEVTFAAPVTIRAVPEGAEAPISVDLPATSDPVGTWTLPSPNAVREALRQRLSSSDGAPTAVGKAGFNSGAVDISAPGQPGSLSKSARTGGDITGATPPPETLTLPRSGRASATISLDGEPAALEADDELTPVPNSDKPYVPPAGSLDGPLKPAQPLDTEPTTE